MPLAQWVAINYVHTNFVAKNSSDPRKAEKLIAIYDEGHVPLRIPYVAERIAYQYRTARKRYVSVWLSLQQIKDLEIANANGATDGDAIIENTACFFLFKHSSSSIPFLRSHFAGMTDSQLNSILEFGGASDASSVSEGRKGECAIIDGGHVYFVKIKYLRNVEAAIAETDPVERARAYERGNIHVA